MRILHLDGAREDFGGVLSVLRNMVTASAPMGWRHAVWVNEGYRERRQPALEYRRSRHIVSDSPDHFRLLIQAFRAYGELAQLLREEHFDLLHAHSRGSLIVALIAALRLSRPVVFTNHNYARRHGFYRWAARRRNVHTILLTPNMARFYGLTVEPPRVSVISSCYADRLLQEPLVERRIGVNDKCLLRLVGVGTLFRWKNWHLVAEAVARLAADERACLQFSLLGPTPDAPEPQQYEGELRQLIQKHGLEERFQLRGPVGSVADELRRADWLIHPATNEPCGLALLEAMALGLPVLVSRSGGPMDFVQPERNGLFFAPDDAAGLAAQLRRILRGEVSVLPPAELRETVRERSGSGVLPQYQELYRQVMATQGPRQ